MPTPLAPMLATTGALPLGQGWAYEFKWDGVRAIAHIAGGVVRFYARSGADVTVAYPEFGELGKAVPDAVLDGEIVSLDDSGRPSFSLLAERMHVRDARRAATLAATRAATYMIFDVLALDGVVLTGMPYRSRREKLEKLGLDGDHWLVPPAFTDGPATRAAAEEHQMEGLMAKRLSSTYRPGTRSPDWIKVKIDQTAEFVVGGFRPGARTLGALFIGAPTPTGGLAYRGRVGGGISDASEKALLAALRPLAVDRSPFETEIPKIETRGATWVRPELVIEVKYGQQTRDGRLRFPRFLRIRPDLSPAEVGAAGTVEDA